MSACQYVQVGGMSESHYGIDTLVKIKEEELGNYTVLFLGPWDIEKLKKIIPFCQENGIRFAMDETYCRLRGSFLEPFDSYKKDKFQDVLKSAGDYYDGTLFMCEYGGLTLYWPEDYVKSSSNTLPKTRCAQEAKDFMVDHLRKMIEDSKERLLLPPIICIEAAGGVSKYLYEAGIDRVDLEVTYDKFTEFYYSAVKGASIAYGKKQFGVDMAMVCYGGNCHDELWFKRWRISLYHAYLRGADPIYAEHGLMNYSTKGKHLDTNAPEVKRFRAELAEFANFAKENPRPNGFPLAKIAFIYGNLDSFAMGQPYVWGQRDKNGITSGDPENSWDIFNSIYRKHQWEFKYRFGNKELSGNPPLGQADVLPIEASLKSMQVYSCLIFMGWNTITGENYEKLKQYVKNGGHILCTLGHLNIKTNRDDQVKLFNNGDFSDLFGVKVKLSGNKCRFGMKFKKNPVGTDYQFPFLGAACDPQYGDAPFSIADVELTSAEITAAVSEKHRDDWKNMDKTPVLTSNKLGKGRAFLLHTPEYPGHSGIRRLYTDLIGFFAAAHQDKKLQIVASDTVRYAVYEENKKRTLYLLNTDYDLSHEVIICSPGKREIISVKAAEMKIVNIL